MIATYQKDLLKNISTWIEILEEMSKNTTDTSCLPKLEVSLRSGKTFSGSVIGLKKSSDENLLMLLEQADTNSKARIHLIQCEEISALSFIEPSTYLSIFSKPIISELELKRKVQRIEDQLEQLVSKRIPISVHHHSISESDRSHILQLIEELPAIFRNIITDDMSKKLVSESIANIEIQMGKTADTRLNEKNLVCTFAKATELFLTKQKESFFHSIENVL